MHTLNDKSLARKKFCGLLDFIQMWGKLASSVLKVLPLLKAFLGKTLRFIENPQSFSRVAFVVYGIYISPGIPIMSDKD